jgi:hypothetical protein
MGTSTLWSVIRVAQGSGPHARAALGELIRRYEKSVEALIRHRGHPPDQTPEDLKQAFFARILAGNGIARLDKSRGQFRGWLHTAVVRFLYNDWDRWNAEKAGNTITGPLTSDPTGGDDPERRYLVAFAWDTLRHAADRVREDERDKERFDSVRRFLPGPDVALAALAPIAESLEMSRTALAAHICHLRARFREILRIVVADTIDLDATSVDAEQEIEKEMASVYAILRETPDPWAS